MAVYLDESMIGKDREINYPHLLLCIGVTCQMADGTLIGCHIDSGGDVEDKNLAELRQWITAHGGAAVNLYLIGNRHVNRKHNGKSDFEKAYALGFTGKVWVFDTAGIASTDGHFARLTSNPTDPRGMCDIRVCADPDVRPYKFHASTDDISGLQVVKRTLTPTGTRMPRHGSRRRSGAESRSRRCRLRLRGRISSSSPFEQTASGASGDNGKAEAGPLRHTASSVCRVCTSRRCTIAYPMRQRRRRVLQVNSRCTGVGS